MWGTVLLMAVVVAVDPAQVGAVAYILSRPTAMRLLVAYFIGGFGVSLIAGGVLLFILGAAGFDVSRMCPATDREKVKNVDHSRSAKPLVTGPFGFVRVACGTA